VEVLEVKGAKRLKYLQALPVLRRLSQNVDIIHGHYAFCGWLARAAWSKPVVCSFMGDDLLGSPDRNGHFSAKGRLIVQASRTLARLVDAVIVKSPEMASIVAPVKAYVVPNGVDMERFTSSDQATARRELGWSLDKRYILFPGNPKNPRKGFDLANAALEAAQHQSNNELEMAVLRNVSPDQVPVYMNACDAMFMTSWVEGSPNVVKEAMACNLPVVSVPVGDVEQLLGDVDGYAVCPRDPVELANALLESLADPQVPDGRGALVRKKLDAPSVARRLIDIYSSVLSQKTVSPPAVTMESR
jgi:glycosyltransferase involved in cell wall biosynthesis